MLRPDVALVAPYPAPGTRHDGWSGVASYTANLAHALSGAGARVEVVAPREPGMPARHDDGPVHVRRAFRRGPGAVPAAAFAARATGAPVVHLQHETFLYGGPGHIPGLVSALGALRVAGRRIVVTMHHVVAPASVDRDFVRLHGVRAPVPAVRAGLRGVTSALRRVTDALIVHEPAFTSAVPGADVVHHGIETADPATPDAARRAALGLDPDRLTVLCFGFVAPYKGLEAILDAGRRARESVQVIVAGGPHPRLVASGDDYDARLAAEHGDHALFTGYVADEDIAGLFADVDVAVLPYPRPVAASGALALALAHGTPVLLSPELAETIAAPAPLVVPRDPQGLAARLDGLARDREALGVIAAATAQLADGRSWSASALRHLDLYAGVAA